jgi:hypothetical protein
MSTYTNKEFAALALSDPHKLLLAFQDKYNEEYERVVFEHGDESEIDGDVLLEAAESYFTGAGVLGLYLKMVDQEGGYEGGGDHAEMVFAISSNNNVLTYLRITGYFNSYDGTRWNDEVVVVYPQEVTETKYFT